MNYRSLPFSLAVVALIDCLSECSVLHDIYPPWLTDY